MFPRKFHIETGVANNQLCDYLIGILYDARSTTYRYIQGVTQEELDWQPHEGWNTIGALLAHIIAGDYFFALYFIEKREMTPEEEKALLPGLDWQPHEGWNTIGALLAHIIAGDYFFALYFIEKREMTPEEEKALLPGLDLGEHVKSLKGKTPEYYLKELEASHLHFVEAIKKLSTEELLERRFDVYDKVNGSDLAWTLYHNAEDEVHHRGQISILRKLYKQMREKQSEGAN